MIRISQNVIQTRKPTERIERIHFLIEEECNLRSVKFQMYLNTLRMPQQHSATRPVVAEMNPRFVKRPPGRSRTCTQSDKTITPATGRTVLSNEADDLYWRLSSSPHSWIFGDADQPTYSGTKQVDPILSLGQSQTALWHRAVMFIYDASTLFWKPKKSRFFELECRRLQAEINGNAVAVRNVTP